jgi:hypothetical protein
MDQAMGLLPRARGKAGEPESAKVARVKRDRAIAIRMARLIGIGFKAPEAARLIERYVQLHGFVLSHLTIKDEIWPRLQRKDRGGFLKLVQAEGAAMANAEAKAYLKHNYRVAELPQRRKGKNEV